MLTKQNLPITGPFMGPVDLDLAFSFLCIASQRYLGKELTISKMPELYTFQ